MMTIKVNSFIGIAVVVMLLVISSTPVFAWYYYANTNDRVWEEASLERETLPVGTVVSALPNGARSIIIERTQYFVSGENWFLPISNNEGIKYKVVFAPV